ncbi:MAG: TonB family protein [Acidobacteriota bacterium]
MRPSTHRSSRRPRRPSRDLPIGPTAGDRREQRVFRGALLTAAIVHLGLLLLVLPEASVLEATPEPPRVIELAPTPRFEPPAPPPEPQTPEPRTTRDAIPVPTAPPEPVPVPETQPDLPPVVIAERAAIPAPPPEGLRLAEPPKPSGPLRLGGEIEPPVRVHFVKPRYPSVARRARVGGTIHLEAVIGTDGRVVDVKPLAGLPLGITEAAIEAVEQWRYEPARLGGRPVAVFLDLRIDFTLTH